MVLLTRTVRFSVNDGDDADAASRSPAHNTFAAYPSMLGIGRHFELDITCRGKVDAATGYFLNIKDIDRAVRATLIPAVSAASRRSQHPCIALRDGLAPLNAALSGSLASVRWRLSPYYSIEMSPASSPPPSGAPARATALLRQQFEFAAAHRLHIAALSDAENYELFGKCNNPRGHGHNYRVEPSVEVVVPADGAPAFNLRDLERLTAELIINRYDHRHLNEDTREFGCGPGGLNPSVENIAMVCFNLLAPAVAAAGAKLRSITVWETDKTSCTYPAASLPGG